MEKMRSRKTTARAKAKDEIQGSLHCGGKSAAYGRDDMVWWVWGVCCSVATFGDNAFGGVVRAGDEMLVLFLQDPPEHF